MSAAGNAFRGALTAWGGLIVLQVAGTANGSGRLAELATKVNELVQAAISPSVAAIPDRRYRGVTDADGNFHPAVPGYLGGGVVGGPGKLPPGSKGNPDFTPADPAPNSPWGMPSPGYGDPSKPGGLDV